MAKPRRKSKTKLSAAELRILLDDAARAERGSIRRDSYGDAGTAAIAARAARAGHTAPRTAEAPYTGGGPTGGPPPEREAVPETRPLLPTAGQTSYTPFTARAPNAAGQSAWDRYQQSKQSGQPYVSNEEVQFRDIRDQPASYYADLGVPWAVKPSAAEAAESSRLYGKMMGQTTEELRENIAAGSMSDPNRMYRGSEHARERERDRSVLPPTPQAPAQVARTSPYPEGRTPGPPGVIVSPRPVNTTAFGGYQGYIPGGQTAVPAPYAPELTDPGEPRQVTPYSMRNEPYGPPMPAGMQSVSAQQAVPVPPAVGSPYGTQSQATGQGSYRDAAMQRVFDSISRAEGTTEHGFNTVYGGGYRDLSSMSINQVLDMQKEMIRTQGASPVGKFQITRDTLQDFAGRAELDFDKTNLTPEVQERLTEMMVQESGFGRWDGFNHRNGPAHLAAAKKAWEQVQKLPGDTTYSSTGTGSRPGGDAAVRAQQEALNTRFGAGLTVDGIMGPRTREAMARYSGNAPGTPGAGLSGAYPSTTGPATTGPATTGSITGESGSRSLAQGGGRFSTVGSFGAGVDPGLMGAIQSAAEKNGYVVEAFSGLNPRSTGTTNHPSGNAADIRIMDPSTGQPLGGDPSPDMKPELFRQYEAFAQDVNAEFAAANPDRANNLRWGGYFVQGTPMDLMHFDVSGGNMAAGNFKTGLKPEYAKMWGVTAPPISRTAAAAAGTIPTTVTAAPTGGLFGKIQQGISTVQGAAQQAADMNARYGKYLPLAATAARLQSFFGPRGEPSAGMGRDYSGPSGGGYGSESRGGSLSGGGNQYGGGFGGGGGYGGGGTYGGSGGGNINQGVGGAYRNR